MTDFIHGKASTYNNHKCRCELCTVAWAEYQRPRIRKWRAEQKLRKQREQKVQINF